MTPQVPVELLRRASTATTDAETASLAFTTGYTTGYRAALFVPPPARIGDLIGRGARGIPDNVIEVVSSEDDRWRRSRGGERYPIDPETGELDRTCEYDWVTPGGRSTTEGLLEYAPLRVTRVVDTCIRCKQWPAYGGPCCSSHNKPLCHLCYRRTHFAELCIPGCPDCAREGLPVNLHDWTGDPQ